MLSCTADRGRQGGRRETWGVTQVERYLEESCQNCCPELTRRKTTDLYTK